MRLVRVKFVLLLFLLILVSCSTSVRFTANSINPSNSGKNSDTYFDFSDEYYSLSEKQYIVLNEAEKWIGIPYCYGGESLNCTDCSGFVKRIFEKVGLSIPRTAFSQYRNARPINFSEREIGDLIFFGTDSQITHVGIYIGSNRMIHASSSLGVVKQSLDNSYYRRNFAGYGRIL